MGLGGEPSRRGVTLNLGIKVSRYQGHLETVDYEQGHLETVGYESMVHVFKEGFLRSLVAPLKGVPADFP